MHGLQVLLEISALNDLSKAIYERVLHQGYNTASKTGTSEPRSYSTRFSSDRNQII